MSSIYEMHYVAIIGGSISGSEAARILAENGFRVVVFEMNNLPYGKIEDGLPNWHIKLRDRQIEEINSKLNHKNIRFVPSTKIGKDINFLELVNDWGFSAIILANGAWQDRELPIPKINDFINKQLVYQNSFIYWFNHKHEENYKGNTYDIKKNTLVIGGGLASLDVIKIAMIEKVKTQLLLQKGIELDLFELEKQGIQKSLEKYNLRFTDLNIEKAKLIYRRSAQDMPLKSPKDESEESIIAAKRVSEKLLNKYVEKYLFEFIPYSIPTDFVEVNNEIKKIVFQKVEVINGKISPVNNGYFQLDADMIISSIGSLPERIEGLSYEYSSLKMRGEKDYHVYGYDNVFAIGNAVTGRGNIQESKKHGKQMTEKIINKHLTEEALEDWLTQHNKNIRSEVLKQLNTIVDEIANTKTQSEEIIEKIIFKTNTIHKNIGFKDYSSWIAENMPTRLENLIKK